MQLQIFKYQNEEEQMFNEISTIEIDSEIWFVATDICKALEIKDIQKALLELDSDDKQISTILIDGQDKSIVLINESGLYTLIFKSEKDTAQRFRKWITKEVIPSIRKKGFYGKIDRAQLPNFYIRYRDNLQKIPRNYFSVISELFVTLNAEFEKYGYTIPDKGVDGKGIYPDISIGKLFSSYLNEINHPMRDSFKTYKHSFPDKRRGCEVRMYPLELLLEFRKFVFDKWVPENAEKYFKVKDPVAIDYLPKLLGLNKITFLQMV
jgi:prophage antirepressor-like protein